MRHRPAIAVVFGLLLLGIVVILSRPPAHAPGDLRYWVYAGGGKDWSREAAREQPAAEFSQGASFLLTNFCVMGESTGWPSIRYAHAAHVSPEGKRSGRVGLSPASDRWSKQKDGRAHFVLLFGRGMVFNGRAKR